MQRLKLQTLVRKRFHGMGSIGVLCAGLCYRCADKLKESIVVWTEHFLNL